MPLRLPLDTNFAEMLTAHLIAECVSEFFEGEAAIDDRPDPARIGPRAGWRLEAWLPALLQEGVLKGVQGSPVRLIEGLCKRPRGAIAAGNHQLRAGLTWAKGE